jgi:hypothetical protein
MNFTEKIRFPCRGYRFPRLLTHICPSSDGVNLTTWAPRKDTLQYCTHDRQLKAKRVRAPIWSLAPAMESVEIGKHDGTRPRTAPETNQTARRRDNNAITRSTPLPGTLSSDSRWGARGKQASAGCCAAFVPELAGMGFRWPAASRT